jgi:NADPH:quinone reductase
MRCLRFTQFGDPNQVLHVEEAEEPVLASSEVLVKIIASGINPSDAKNVIGHMENTTLPRTPGRDFAGFIEKGPAELIGKSVWGSGGELGFTADGAHSQFIRLPIDGFAIKPKTLSDDEAASSALSFVTAYLCHEAGTATGRTETVMVIGASGGVGNAAIQICKYFGHRAIGLVRSQASAEKMQESGFEAFATDKPDPSEDLRRLGLEAVDLVIDTVGGSMVNVAFSILAEKGRIVEITAPPKDREIRLDARDFYHRQASLIGVDSRKSMAPECARILDKLAPLFEGAVKRMQPVTKISLEQAIEAYSKIASGQSKERFSIHPNE